MSIVSKDNKEGKMSLWKGLMSARFNLAAAGPLAAVAPYAFNSGHAALGWTAVSLLALDAAAIGYSLWAERQLTTRHKPPPPSNTPRL